MHFPRVERYHKQSGRNKALLPAKPCHSALTKRASAAAASLLLGITGMSVGVSAGHAQATRPRKATVLEILDRPELFIDRRRAQVKDSAKEPESLRTLQCRAHLAFDNGAGGRMIRGSMVRLGDCFFLGQGSVLVSGPMCACSPSVRVCSKSTNYIFEAMDGGDAAVTSLEGLLEVQLLDNDLATSRPFVAVGSGQRLRFYQNLDMTTVVDLTPEDYRGIFEGPFFKGFRQRLPNQGALEDYLKANVPGVSLPEPEPESAVREPGALPILLPILFDLIPRRSPRPNPDRRPIQRPPLSPDDGSDQPGPERGYPGSQPQSPRLLTPSTDVPTVR